MSTLRHIVVIASHLSTPQRAQTLRWALESVADQTLPADQVILCVSGEPELVESAKAHFASTAAFVNIEWNDRHANWESQFAWVFRPSAIRRSQFQHIHGAMDAIKAVVDNDTIFHFLDDDDWYPPGRIAAVDAKFQEAPEAEAVCCSWKIVYEDGLEPLPIGRVDVGDVPSCDGGREYWCYAVRAPVLYRTRDFILGKIAPAAAEGCRMSRDSSGTFDGFYKEAFGNTRYVPLGEVGYLKRESMFLQRDWTRPIE